MQNLLTEKQAAEKMGLTERTLQNWRYTGKGPDYIKLSHRAVRYRESDLAEWVEERRFTSTAEESAVE